MNIREYLEASAKVLSMVPDTCESDIRAAGAMLRAALAGGHTIFWCGNGGSAADAQHFSAELVGGMGKKLRPYASVALTTDTSFLTAYANDVEYDEVFVRQVQALGKEGDVLVGISTSGQSENVLRALALAGEVKGMGTILLTGSNPTSGLTQWPWRADVEIVVPSRDTQHIQEAHTAIGHLLCLLAVEEATPALNQTYQEAFTEKYNRSRDLGWEHDEAVRRATHEAAHYQ